MKRRFKLRYRTIFVYEAVSGWIVLTGEKIIKSRKAGIKRLRELRTEERRRI